MLLGHAAKFANDVILVLSLDGRILEANEQFSHLYGYDAGEAASLTLADLRSETSRDHLAADLARAAALGEFACETEHRRKDGTVFPVEVSSRLVAIDGAPHHVSIIRDISERKAAQNRLIRVGHLYRAVSVAYQALLYSKSADEVFRRICSVSTDFGLKLAWVGLVEDDKVVPVQWSGEGSDYLDGLRITVDPDDPSAWGPTGTAARLGRHVICNDFQDDPLTAPWHERGRTHGWMASGAFPLFRLGRTVGALTIYSGERGYFGADEIRLLDDLAAGISFVLDRIEIESAKKELEAALQKSLDQLTNANIELERFAEIYSHDLQEPIRNVVSFSQLLARRLGDQLGEDDRSTLATIIDAAKRIGQLNLDLLAYSRSRRDGGVLATADAGKALDYASGELDERMRAAGAELRVKGLPVVVGSDAEIRQVFINLLSNSLKFADHRPPLIEVEARPEQDFWHFTFRDNGIGVAEEYHEKIFGVFVRLHPTSLYPGSGVGLAITRRIIERLGGRIWIESRLGAGTTVHFLLRKPQEDAPQAAAVRFN